MTPLHRIRERWDAFTHETERAVAPHVDEDWAEALLLELRLRGVPGDVVGGVLAEVDAHVVDSGTTARDAFGDPVAYARSLDLPTVADGPRDHLRSAGPVGLQLIGMLLVLWSTTALAGGEPVTITAGHVATAGLVAVQLVALALRSDVVLRGVVERPVLAWFAFMGLMGLNVVALVVLRQPVLSAPAPVTVAVGLLLLAAGTGLAWARHRSGVDDDPVLSPVPGGRTGAGGQSGVQVGARSARRWGAVGVWLLPVWTVVLAATTWALVATAS
jgi:hypothetical protein